MIIVDDRERDIIKYLRAKDIEYKIQRLDVGDYLFKNDDLNIIVERKNINDLVSSYISGRLYKQFKKLSEQAIPILLVTGSMSDVSDRLPTVSHSIVEHITSEAVIRYGFRSVIWILGPFDDPKNKGVLFLLNAFKELQDRNYDKISLKSRKKYSHKTQAIVSTFGVSEGVAEQLLKRFGNLKGIMGATDNKLLEVPGLGPVRVKLMRDIIGV